MRPHQNTDRPEDREAETHKSITARLEGAKASQAQIRFTLGMMAVISMMMLIASYNAYFSYDYHWIIGAENCQEGIFLIRCKCGTEPQPEAGNTQLAPSSPSSLPPPSSRSEEVAKTLGEQALKDWASSRIVLISLLGIRVSVDDAPILGTSVLLILSVWLLLWARRENYTIGRLLHDTYNRNHDDNRDPPVTQEKRGRTLYSDQDRWLIFHSIYSSSIFLAIYPSSSSVKSLDSPLPKTMTGFKGKADRVWFRFLRNFFFLFPVIGALIVFAIDRRSYFIPDPFDPYFGCPGIEERPFFWWSVWGFIVLLAPLVFCCWRSMRYARDTEKVLRQYEAKLDPDHSKPAQPSTS